MNRVALDRRRFLKLVGASALTYPFLRGVPSYAQASGSAPIYLVLLFSANGCVRYRWGAQGAPPTSLAPTATGVTNGPLQFRPTLSAFASAGPTGADLTKYVTVLDGLFNKAAIGGTHETGMSALWTGLVPGVGSQKSPGPSIDQVIAAQLNPTTPYSSVAMVVQSSADFSQSRSVDNRMIYDLNGNWVDPVATTPAGTIAKLFPTMMGSSSSSGPNKTLFIRQQVWNHVNADLTRLQSRLCTEDRQQLQNLQGLWNTILNQLQAAAAQAAMCNAPSAGGAAGAAGDAGGAAGSDPFPQYAQVMPNILAMTLACNLTQIASLQYSQALSPVTFTWLGSSQTQTHHIYSHQTPAYPGALFSGLEPLPTNADLYDESSSVSSLYPQQLMDIETWYAQQVASLAYTFTQTSVGGGKTLLDQSLICWGSEIDMGAAHNHDDTPFVLIGGAGGKLKCTTTNGQLVRFPLNLAGYSQNNNQMGIRCHNDLLLTIADIMGVSAAQVQSAYGTNWSGFNSMVSGPITDILAT